MLISTPPKLEIKFSKVGIAKRIIKLTKPILKNIDKIDEQIMIKGSIIENCNNDFASNNFFILIGQLFKIQNCFPSSETLQHEICVVLIKPQKTNVSNAVSILIKASVIPTSFY